MLLNKIFCLVVLIFVASEALGQGRCAQSREPEFKAEVLSLVDDVSSGKVKVKSPDDFISKLPEGMRKDFLRYDSSESLQASYHNEPRIVLMSPKMEFFISYSTKPGTAGYDNVEMIFYDEKQQGFELRDLNFDEELMSKDGKPTMTRNPSQCLNCHGNPPKFIYDTYNFWAQGMTPFNKDIVNFACKEGKEYADWFENISDRPRDRHLIPPISKERLAKAEQEKGRIRVPRAGNNGQGDGPSVDMFDETVALNGCRIDKKLQETKHYDLISAMREASKRQCFKSPGQIERVLPPQYNDMAVNFFRSQGMDGENVSEIYNELKKDTLARQKNQFESKKKRVKKFFTSKYGEEGGEKEFQCHENTEGIQDRESSGYSVANTRFFLEPLGVDVNQWSMSIDPNSYTFADLWSDTWRRVETKFSNMQCNEIAAEIKDLFSDPSLFEDQCSCGAGIETKSDHHGNMSFEMDKSVTAILQKNRCVHCHVQAGDPAAPQIPIRDAQGLKTLIATSYWAKSVLQRTGITDATHGRMPKFRAEMPKIEREILRSFIEENGNL